jgi:hypothetical protein
VYLAAFLIPNGETLMTTAHSDPDSLINSNTVVNQEQGSTMLKAEAFRDALYGDCSQEDIVLATALLTPEPIAPSATPLSLSEEQFGRIPRVYIETLQDKGVTPALQKKMYTVTTCQHIISMDTSHSPFLSQPQQLASHLTSFLL